MSVFISEWELVSQGILALSNSFSKVTKLGKLNDSDLNVHHELLRGYSKLFSESVQKVVKFINEKGNPFKKKSSVFLFNFCTGQTKRNFMVALFMVMKNSKNLDKSDLLKNQSCLAKQ